MKTKNKKTLPKTVAEITNGGVYMQRIRCGKPNCRCARGEHHTAYYFFIYRHGKNIKFYVRKAEVEAFIKIVEQAAIERSHKRKAVKVSNELLSKFRLDLWKNDGLIKTLKGSQDHE